MLNWFIAIVTPLTIAFVIYVTSSTFKFVMWHYKEHKNLTRCRTSFGFMEENLEKNQLEHSELRDVLNTITKANMHQMRAKIVEMHQKLMLEEQVSVGDREVFDGLCEGYYAVGGNGVVQILEKEIDNLPTSIIQNKIE